MTHTYSLEGMTCHNCEADVKSKLLMLPDILSAEVSKETKTATLTMQKHISLAALQTALGGAGSKYKIAAIAHNEIAEQTKSWLSAYKPILLVFGYLVVITVIVSTMGQAFDIMVAMSVFMAGFFLVFSFFKLLDLEGFANSYRMYDIVAMKWKAWGYIYPFIELALGLAFLADLDPFVTNVSTLVVMIISIIGVLQAVTSGRKIRCACLGAVFNLPMSTITIIEDALMIAMSGVMLIGSL